MFGAVLILLMLKVEAQSDQNLGAIFQNDEAIAPPFM